MDTRDFIKLKWGKAFEMRFKKLLLDLTSAKVWVLAIVIYGYFQGIAFGLTDYIFFASVLGLKDMRKLILAFKGIDTNGDS